VSDGNGKVAAQWGMVVHICNPSYLGESRFEASLDKKRELTPPHPQHTSISSWSWWQVPVILLVGGLNKRISVQEGWPKNLRLFSKNNQSKKGWRCGSSGTLESPVLFFFGLVRQGLAVYLRLA
jgi:hypothetical protein